MITDGELFIDTPEAFVPALSEDDRYIGLYGGRGSGKSHFFGERLVDLAAFEPGLRAVCIRETQVSLKRSSKQLIEDKIKALGLSSYFRVMDTEIRTISGGHIIFQGMQDHTNISIKSLEGYDIFWVEEAANLSSRSLGLLRPTVRRTPGRRIPQLWASWNPVSKDDPIDVLFRGDDPTNLPGGGVCCEVNYDDNPWFDDSGLREEMEYDKARDYDKYLHVWMGGYGNNSEARVFKHVRQMEFDTPANAEFFYGGDFGFAIDPTVLSRLFIGDLYDTGLFYPNGKPIQTAVYNPNGKTLFIDYEAYRVGCDTDHTPALFAGDCPYTKEDPRWWPNPHGDRGIPGALKWPITCDSSNPQMISYLVRHGFRAQPAIKGPGSVEEGVNFLQSYDIVIHPRCVHSYDEFTTYSYQVDNTVEPPRVLPKLVDKKNHVIDSDRYALEGKRKARGFFSV